MSFETQRGPQITPTPDGYRLLWDARGGHVTALVERLSEHSDGLVAEVSIEYDLPPRPGQLKWGRLDLMAEQTRSRWASALEKRDSDIDWVAILEQLCRTVKDAHRAGTPAVDLREVPMNTLTRWLVEPFVEQGGASILFADGGTGKSLAALAIAITVASGVAVVGTPRTESGPVLYLDWETDAATATERLRAICWGAEIPTLPPVHYRRQVASLEASAQEIRRDIARLGAVMVVVDSLGMARGGEPESADLTIRTFAALRSLGVPALCVDHVTKSQSNDSTRPFGSTYSHNAARLTWSMDKAQEEGGDPTVVLVNRKRNNGRLLPRLCLAVTVEQDDDEVLTSVRYARKDIADTGLAIKYASVSARIIVALKDGGKTRKELSELLEVSSAIIKARVYEMIRRGTLTPKQDGEDERIWRAVEH